MTSKEGNEENELEVSLVLPNVIREERRFMSNLFGYSMTTDFRYMMGYQEILNIFEPLEIWCDAADGTSLNYSRCNVDMTIGEALQWPRGLADRTPMDITRFKQFTIQDLKSMWCRLVAHYFEWIAGVLEVRKMSHTDKLRLVTRQLCKVICWTVAWRTYKLDLKEGITFGCGYIYIPQDDCCPANYVSNLALVIQNLIVTKMRSLQLRRNEYLLLKLAVFFSSTNNIALSPEGQELCSSALNKYMTALVEEVTMAREDLSMEEIRLRVSDMVNSLSSLETVSDVDNKHLMEMTLNNSDNLQGKLTTEIHVHASF